MRRRSLSILLLAAFATCDLGLAMERRVVVFSAEQAQALWRKQEAPFWTPSAKQISELEQRLPKYLTENPPKYGEKVKDWPNYGRQYLGVTKNGRKLIFLNAFCGPYLSTISSEQWHQHLVFVEDGGSCFFQIYFDPSTHQFLDLRYNGIG